MKKIFKYLKSLFKSIKIMINPISQSNQIEFNDSVLETKAWNSSRYDGKQLQASTINEFTNGDITYGKTPVIQNYSRNIYIGNDIIGMDPNNIEDSDLLQFDKFSYAQANYYITINEDDTITTNRLDDSNNKVFNKKGFYKSFTKDFPIGGKCQLIINNPTTKSKLKSSYPIYFNGGQLQKLFYFRPPTDNFVAIGRYHPYLMTASAGYLDSQSFFPYNVGGDVFSQLTSFNTSIATDFYTNSSPERPSIIGSDYSDLMENIFDYKNNSEYKDDKRFFLTFCSYESGSTIPEPFPLRTILSGSMPNGSGQSTPLATQNLAELSTGEIINFTTTLPNDINSIVISSNFEFNQIYNAASASDGSYANTQEPTTSSSLAPSPPFFRLGSYVISKVENSIPSLLIPLDKSIQLQGYENATDKEFVVIPENLHPYIKANLAYFLTRAGIDVGGNTSDLIKLNESNRNLR